jgi:hypothetical protein
LVSVRLASGNCGLRQQTLDAVDTGGNTADTAPAAASFTIDVVEVGTGSAFLCGVKTSRVSTTAAEDTARGDSNRMLAYLRAVAPN